MRRDLELTERALMDCKALADAICVFAGGWVDEGGPLTSILRDKIEEAIDLHAAERTAIEEADDARSH